MIDLKSMAQNPLSKDLDANKHSINNVSSIMGITNVKGYGAKGDGSTDDTIPIENAIAALSSGGTLFFPPGIYRFTNTLTFDKNGAIVGTGIDATVLLKDFNGEGLVISGWGSSVRDLTVDNQSSTDSDPGIVIQNEVVLDRVLVKNQGGHGFLFTDRNGATKCNSSVGSFIKALNNGGDGIHLEGSASAPNVNATLLLAPVARGNSGAGIYIKNCIDNIVIAHLAEYNDWGLVLDGTKGCCVYFPYDEANTSGNIHLLSNTERNTIWVLGRSGLGSTFSYVTDEGVGNLIMARNYNDYWLLNILQTNSLIINNMDVSGLIRIQQNGSNRNLEFVREDTDATFDVDFSSLGNGRGIILADSNGIKYRVYVDTSGAVKAVAL